MSSSSSLSSRRVVVDKTLTLRLAAGFSGCKSSMGSFGYSLSMIASLSPTVAEPRLISPMGYFSTIAASNLSSVFLVSSPVTKRRAQNLVFRSSASLSTETTADVGVVSSTKSKKVSLLFFFYSQLSGFVYRELIKMCRCLFRLDTVRRK